MRRALVVGMGGLRGGYDAGVVATLCRELGPDYFDAVFASSVGVFAATFFLANQPDTLERTWRNFVDGRKLVNFWNPLRRREVLDLEYLTGIFQNEISFLDVEKVFKASASLMYALTEYSSGKTVYRKPDRENLFECMQASAALPFAHRPVSIDNVRYVDGGLSCPLPVHKAIEDGYDEIIAVYNKPEGFYVEKRFRFFHPVASLFLPPSVAGLLTTYERKVREIEELISCNRHVTVIRPKTQIPLRSIRDTNKKRIHEAIDMGIIDARDFVRSRGGTGR